MRSHMTRLFGTGLLVVLFITMLPAVSAATHAKGGALLQLRHDPKNAEGFPWTWIVTTNNLKKIKDAGYSAILLSPHAQACGGQWSVGYDPYDFTSFDSAHGTEAQLQHLINEAHANTLQVYADMIMNHMCANNKFKYPHFGWNDFHHVGGINDWNNEWQVENGSMFGLEDLAHESDYVRSQLWNFLVKTNNMGFDGYRWDGAKHVPKWYWHDHIVNNTNAWGKYSFGEVVQSNIGILDQYVATGMSVTDYNLYDTMRQSFKLGGNLAALDGAGYAAWNGPKALTFVENHDVGAPDNRLLAYAFLSAYPGYPCYYNISLDDVVINNLAWIHNNLAQGSYINRYKDQNTLIFEREQHLLAGINQSAEWVSKWVKTSWQNTKLHDYTFHVKDKWTNGEGYIEIWIPPMAYVMMAP